jgi:hypothetical protein
MLLESKRTLDFSWQATAGGANVSKKISKSTGSTNAGRKVFDGRNNTSQDPTGDHITAKVWRNVISMKKYLAQKGESIQTKMHQRFWTCLAQQRPQR